MVAEFYFWPGDQFNKAEIAYAVTGSDRFQVRPLADVVRQSPRTRAYLDNPANGWIKLQPVSEVVAKATAELNKTEE